LVESTRPAQHRHQARAAIAASLVAFCWSFAPVCASTNAIASQPSETTNTVNQAPETTAISSVATGQEGLELSGRFSQDGNVYVEGIDWEVKTQSGDMVYHSSATTVDLKLSPGAYEVIATYGTVKIDEAVNVPARTKLAVNFVLNAGALRVLPRLKGIDGEQIESATKVYALNGPKNGKLVTTSHQPGQLIKLPAGSYRVETQFSDGNVVAVTDVDVKPGIMRSIDVDHHGGLVHLSVLHAVENIQWLVQADQGEAIELTNLSDPTAVLKPGHYMAQAKSGDQIWQQRFTIEDGQVQDIILAN